jgi:hypothetical protein
MHRIFVTGLKGARLPFAQSLYGEITIHGTGVQITLCYEMLRSRTPWRDCVSI